MGKITSFKNTFQQTLQTYTETGYKIVRAIIFDPAHSIFSSDKNRQCFVEINFCKYKDTCPVYKEKKCLCYNFLLSCPYKITYYQSGFTRRSKSYDSFIADAKEVFGVSDKIVERINALEHTGLIGEGQTVYLHLNHLRNYVNSIDTELGITTQYFISASRFTPEVVNRLLEYRPQALFGGEITTFQEKEIPNFIFDLKRYFPDLYKQCIEGTKYESLIKIINFLEREARVKTLKAGKVKLLGKIWNWNGEKLSRTDELLGGAEVNIIPTEKTFVTIADNDTVTDDTQFKKN